MSNQRFLRALSMGCAVLISNIQAFPALPTPGNLIASVTEFTGSTAAPKYIAEFMTDGTRVQVIASVPLPGTDTYPSTDHSRDLVMGSFGNIHVYNGTTDPYLATLNSNDATWAQETFAGWSSVNNGSYGGIDRVGNYIYVGDMRTGGPGDEPQGIVRFDLDGTTPARFATEIEPIDLMVAPNGVIHALTQVDGVYRYDPNTLESLGRIHLGFGDLRAIDIAADNSIFVAYWNGNIKRFSATGTLLDTLTVPGKNFSDININNSTGQIALGTGFEGEIVLTDLNLDAFTSFAATESSLGGDVFVAWVPEPSMLALFTLGGIAGLATRRRTERRA